MLNKRGLSLSSIFWKVVAVLIILFLIWLVIFSLGNVSIDACEITEAEYNAKGAFGKFVNDYVFFCDVKPDTLFGKATFQIKNILGFNRNFPLFLLDFANGFVIGILIFGSYWLIAKFIELSISKLLSPFRRQAAQDRSKLQSSWLNLIGGNAWKVPLIAIIYTIIMQIPILNRAIEIIALRPILGSDFWSFGWLIQDILLAFYIAFLPGAIEAYSRYKLRKSYYHKIQEAKYGVKIAKGLARG